MRRNLDSAKPVRFNGPVFAGMAPLAQKCDALIIDLWGVIHDGVHLYPGVTKTLLSIRQAGKKIIFLTNSARRASGVVSLLDSLGLDRTLYDAVISSGEAAASALMDPDFCQSLGQTYAVVGSQADDAWTRNLPAKLIENHSAVDFCVTTGLLKKGTTADDWAGLLKRWCKRNVTVVCANPDTEVVIDGDLRVAGGAIAAAYHALGGDVVFFGKPHKQIYDACFSLIPSLSRDRVLAVGDSLATDIAGANAYGISSVLVAETGLAQRARPSNAGKPDAVIKKFCW